MKIIVMIPAYNEEKSIENVIKRVPTIEGHDLSIIVINDGSTDNTDKIAKQAGALVINNQKNMGLGITFRKGLNEALNRDADIIVNIDADGQYNPEDIPKLINPIIKDDFDMVLGTRMENLQYKMPFLKKVGNKFMTRLLRMITGLNIKDGQTGFRAFSKACARTLLIYLRGKFTYTQETIIHACFHEYRIKQIPIEFNERIEGESRLIKNVFNYFINAAGIIIKSYKYYKPMKFFGFIGIGLMIIGIIALVMDYLGELSGTHLIPGLAITNDPKIIITIVIPILLAILFFVFGIILDNLNKSRMNTITTNIQLTNEINKLSRKIEELNEKLEK